MGTNYSIALKQRNTEKNLMHKMTKNNNKYLLPVEGGGVIGNQVFVTVP